MTLLELILRRALDDAPVDSLVTKRHVEELADFLMDRLTPYVEGERRLAWKRAHDEFCEQPFCRLGTDHDYREI